jgi:hypothetical protein
MLAGWLFTVQIKVKRRGDDQKFLARVLAIGVECDMALLTGGEGGEGLQWTAIRALLTEVWQSAMPVHVQHHRNHPV